MEACDDSMKFIHTGLIEQGAGHIVLELINGGSIRIHFREWAEKAFPQASPTDHPQLCLTGSCNDIPIRESVTFHSR